MAATALYLHLVDQLHAGMLTRPQAEDWALHLLEQLAIHFHCPTPQSDSEQTLESWLEAFLAGAIAAHLQEQNRLYPAG